MFSQTTALVKEEAELNCKGVEVGSGFWRGLQRLDWEIEAGMFSETTALVGEEAKLDWKGR